MHTGHIHTGRSPARQPVTFFLLVFILSVPCWLLSLVTGVVPALRVPVSDLAITFVPLVAAAILIIRYEGWSGVRSLLARTFDYHRSKQSIWLSTAVLLPVLIYLLTVFFLYLDDRESTFRIDALQLTILLVMFFIGAAGEELGWMGYAFDPLQQRFGPLTAGIIISIPWWLWHLPSIAQIGGTALYMAWWLPGAIGLRILMSWLYIKTGYSVFAVILFHACMNAGRVAVYPTIGVHYDLAYMATGYMIVCVMALFIVVFRRGLQHHRLQ